MHSSTLVLDLLHQSMHIPTLSESNNYLDTISAEVEWGHAC